MPQCPGPCLTIGPGGREPCRSLSGHGSAAREEPYFSWGKSMEDLPDFGIFLGTFIPTGKLAVCELEPGHLYLI